MVLMPVPCNLNPRSAQVRNQMLDNSHSQGTFDHNAYNTNGHGLGLVGLLRLLVHKCVASRMFVNHAYGLDSSW